MLTLSDSGGFIHDPDGLSQEKIDWVKSHKTHRRGRIEDYVAAYPKATFVAGKTPWGVPCDVALPCATQNELDEDDARALPLYEQVWRMDKSQYAAAAALGAYQMQRGNTPAAIELWRSALAVNPAMTLVRVNLAAALLRTGQVEQARAALEKALEFNPASPEARELLSRIPAK